MFSKSLFKQSCKANGLMWIIITVAVCFMLSCVMLIAGNGSLGDTKSSIENAVIEGELNAQTQQRAVNYYETANSGLEIFDAAYAASYATALGAGKTPEEAAVVSYMAGANAYNTYYEGLLEKLGYTKDSTEGQELGGLLMYLLNAPVIDSSTTEQKELSKQISAFYTACNEQIPHYETVLATIGSETHDETRSNYVMMNSSIFLAGNMIKEENINNILQALASYGVTKEQFHQFGYDDYTTVREIARNSLVNYRANLSYRIQTMKEGETVESIKSELKASMAQGLLATLPQNVSDALKEIGEADLYGTLVGSIFFKMAGLLLPIIYMIMSANALIAGQVDSGSMAYILSSSTKRRKVAFTQALYLIGSIFAMFLCTTVTGMICLAIVDVSTQLTYGKLLLINLGAFSVMFAMSGICFLASCIFNRSKHSMALGGGLNMFFLVATMLGLFGSPVLPSIIRMKALNAFNYVTIISLFDVVSILEGTLTFLWKLAILAAIGIVCYIVGSLRFDKKDLPL